jgi:hypothetical protein
VNDARNDAPDFLGALAARTVDAGGLEPGASLQPRMASRFEDAKGRVEAGPGDLEIIEEETEAPMPSVRRTGAPAQTPLEMTTPEEPTPNGLEHPEERAIPRAPRPEPRRVVARTQPDTLEPEMHETPRAKRGGLLEPATVTRPPSGNHHAEPVSELRTPRGSLVTAPTRGREPSRLEARDEAEPASSRVVEHVLERHTERETRTISLAPETRNSRENNLGRIEPHLAPEQEPIFESAPPQPIERTVRVTIGRLEVRVQSPPAPPAARARPRAKVMSLEEYIKQRDGGTR